ncbi:hypothetical protein PM082_006935 [Marasmius tenuissimus]|nr:hypothetical protein PM082_006935 [Marasmius tenuissimus]
MGRTVGVRHKRHLNLLAAKYSSVVAPAACMKKTRNKGQKRAPVTRAERERRRQNQKSRDITIKKRIAALRRHVRDECNTLAGEYDMKARYFLDMFFQGGVRLTKPVNKPNPFNAFKWVKSREIRAAGGPVLTVQQIQDQFKDEYNRQTPEERQKTMDQYLAGRDQDARERVKRPTVREKCADAAGGIKQITGIFSSLKQRVGIEAAAVIVKNRPEKIMKPQWIFTDSRIPVYLPTILKGWNTAMVGKKIEALAVAGCDPTKLVKNTKDQIDILKKESAALIQDSLDEACSTKNLTMQYERFDKLITLVYGVVCEGWPEGLPFQKPSSFGTSDELYELRDAWRDGTATFRKLDNDEFEAWRKAREQGLHNGTIIPKARKKRRDAGTKRGKRGKPKVAEAEEESESESSDDEGDDEGKEAENVSPPTAATKGKSAKASGSKVKKPVKSSQNAKAVDVPAVGKKATASASSANSPTSDFAPIIPPDDSSPPTLPVKPPRPRPQRRPNKTERDALNNTIDSSISPITPGLDSSSNEPSEHAVTTQSPSSVQIDDEVIDPQLLPPPSPVHSPAPDPISDPKAPHVDATVVSREPSAGPSTSKPPPAAQQNIQKRKHREISQDPGSRNSLTPGPEDPEHSRPKRNRAPPKRPHLGASTHPASHAERSDGED